MWIRRRRRAPALRPAAVIAAAMVALVSTACSSGGGTPASTLPASTVSTSSLGSVGSPGSVSSAAASDGSSPAASGSSSAAVAAPGAGVFDGVAVSNPTDLKAKPIIRSGASSAPTALAVKDLVVGSGTAATPRATVSVQYVGVLYFDGKQFDASWDHGQPASFPLTSVVSGFSQGIGGTTGVAPMKVGGRRIMILPASLGYGARGTTDGSIPPNSPIVFVVDLLLVQ